MLIFVQGEPGRCEAKNGPSGRVGLPTASRRSFALTAHDARYGRIFGIHQVHDLETRGYVDSLGVAIALLGAAGIMEIGFGHGRWRQIRR